MNSDRFRLSVKIVAAANSLICELFVAHETAVNSLSSDLLVTHVADRIGYGCD